MGPTMAANLSEFLPKPNATRYEPHFHLTYHPSLLVISFLIITTNVMVIVLFMTRESLRKGGKLLLCSLAISDLTTGLVTIPLNISCEATFSVILCVSSSTMNRFIGISTIYHILAITFETYYAVLRPMEHRVNIARGKVLGIVSSIWLVASLLAATPIAWLADMRDVRDWPSDEFLRKQGIYEIAIFSIAVVIPVVLMVFAHARMFARIVRVLKLVRARSTTSTSQPSNTTNYKTALLFALILLVFILSWSFWFVTGLAKVFGKVRHPIPEWAMDCLTILRYSTSFINPLLYTFFRPDFSKSIKEIFNKTSGRRRPSTSFTFLLGTSRPTTPRDTQMNSPIATKSPSLVAIDTTAAPSCISSSLKMVNEEEYDTKV